MISIKGRYVVDGKGKKTGVILGIKDYQRILDELEELESIRPKHLATRSSPSKKQ
jgi:PHD/YefM family antitoxin component YafN of YafNO toxin-antitoxin module